MSNKLVKPRKTGVGSNLKFTEEVIEVSNFDEFLKLKIEYKRNQKIKSKCPICGKEQIRQLRVLENLNCTNCKVDREAVILKSQKTKIEKYGNANYNNQSKRKSSILKTYGSYSNIAQKSALTRKQHSSEDPNFQQEIDNKRLKTINRKYGSFSNMVKGASKKAKQTKKKRYGDPNWNNQQKRLKTLEENGSNCFSKRISYNGEYFDSRWELVFFEYHQLKHIMIERNYNKFFEYRTSDGKMHRYYPDFYVEGKPIEIKGDHLMKNHTSLDGHCWEEKYQCMVANNVKIYLRDDLQDIFKYVADIHSHGSKKALMLEWCKQFETI